MEEHTKTVVYNIVILNAQVQSLDFYLKLNYKIYDDSYFDAGINHFPMEMCLLKI